MVGRRQFLVGVAAGSAGVAAGALGSRITVDAVAPDAPTDTDVGFCTDMTAHHVQALAMCQRVLGRDTGDPVQAAASEVLQNQSIEVGMMRAWLTDWGASTAAPVEVMAWMPDAMEMPGTEMPGYATADQLRELSIAEGRDRGRMWIVLMRAHHLGGVAMANAALSLTTSKKVGRLAQTQVDVQTFEIGQYDLLLAGEYA